MKLKKILAAGVMAAVLASTTLGAAAAPLGKTSSVTLRDIFDAEYYASRYPDLQRIFGNDEEKLYWHFLTYGLKEGRNMSPILDVAAYREAYGDLDKVFGDDWDKYVEHFFVYGAREGREEGVLFNPVQYAEAYSDVADTYGNDLTAITKHYMTFGMNEKRAEGTSKGYESIGALKEAEKKQEESSQAASASQSPAQTPDTPVNPVPTGTPSAPVNPVPTETPSIPVNPLPTETPNTPVDPAPTETPDTPVNPAPTETPDTPVDPVPTETPDTPVNPTPTETPDTPGTIDEDPTEQEVYNAMIALKSKYPDGTPWTDENQSYVWHAIPGVNVTGTGCAAFAFILSDAAFGTETQATKLTDVSRVRVGDIIRMYNNTHYVVVLTIADNGDVTVAEGNINDSVFWGRVIEKAEFESSFDYLYTRYKN